MVRCTRIYVRVSTAGLTAGSQPKASGGEISRSSDRAVLLRNRKLMPLGMCFAIARGRHRCEYIDVKNSACRKSTISDGQQLSQVSNTSGPSLRQRTG